MTVLDMIRRYGAAELAQRADRGLPRLVSDALFAAAAAGEDISAFPESEQAAAKAAVTVVSDAVADAMSTVDGYLSARYAVPLVPMPAAVLRITGDIARYYLYEDMATETIIERYKQAIAWLRDVAAGKVSLGDATATPSPASGGTAKMVTSPAVWRRENGGFV